MSTESSPIGTTLRLLPGGSAAGGESNSSDRSCWFRYVAADRHGARVEGRELAGSELELDRILDARGLVLLSTDKEHRSKRSGGPRLGRAELVAFTQQLATMLAAGIPMLSALREIRGRARSRVLKERIGALLEDLEAGHSLSQALDAQERSFPRTYRATVFAGERSAKLPEVLTGQAGYLEWVGQIRATTVQALIYPALLAGAVLVLVFILMTFLLPRLVTLYPGGAGDLPRETRLLMAISDALVANFPWILGGLVLVAVVLYKAARIPRARIAGARLALRLPRLGDLMRMLATSRFAKTASLLHEAGCDIVESLTLAGDSCGNAYLAHAFSRATDHVRRGETIAESLEREPGMDPFLVQLVGVGETSGDLGGSLRSLTEAYDKEVPRTVKWALSLIEPTVVLVGGVLVLGILLAALLPIVTLYESL